MIDCVDAYSTPCLGSLTILREAFTVRPQKKEKKKKKKRKKEMLPNLPQDASHPIGPKPGFSVCAPSPVYSVHVTA
jgi:hypothetical protein